MIFPEGTRYNSKRLEQSKECARKLGNIYYIYICILCIIMHVDKPWSERGGECGENYSLILAQFRVGALTRSI